MISKRNYSSTQKFTLLCIDTAEKLAVHVPTILLTGAAILGIVFTQKAINRRVEAKCDLSVYVVVQHPTAVGPVYQCISRARLKGPAPALAD